MESPAVSQLFKQLFQHRPCQTCLTRHVRQAPRRLYSSQKQYTSPNYQGRRKEDSKLESNWQQRSSSFPPDKLEEYKRYPQVTSDGLRARKDRPRRVRMLMR
ncbi:hypothetical protein KCU79_g457, partial [Aureobasidium melanogenum]